MGTMISGGGNSPMQVPVQAPVTQGGGPAPKDSAPNAAGGGPTADAAAGAAAIDQTLVAALGELVKVLTQLVALLQAQTGAAGVQGGGPAGKNPTQTPPAPTLGGGPTTTTTAPAATAAPATTAAVPAAPAAAAVPSGPVTASGAPARAMSISTPNGKSWEYPLDQEQTVRSQLPTAKITYI